MRLFRREVIELTVDSGQLTIVVSLGLLNGQLSTVNSLYNSSKIMYFFINFFGSPCFLSRLRV